jgi:beta-mannosidase
MKKFGCLIIFTLMITNLNLFAQGNTSPERLPLTWTVGHADQLNEDPGKWYPAKVPGAVQLDMAKGLNYGTYYFAENWKDYLWMENEFFTYRTSFNKPIVGENQKCLFISKGIDYEFEIWLNGEKLFYQEGMFTPVKLDLTSKLKDKNELLVKIYPIPKLRKEPADRSQAAQSVKPAVSYGWDWHPRLVPSGIWDETNLVIQSQSEISDLTLNYSLDKALKKVAVSYGIKGTNLENCRYLWTISDAQGIAVLNKEGAFGANEIELAGEIDQIKLWWPHDHGNPYLYRMDFRLTDASGKLIDQKTSKIGFRKVQLVMNEGAWDYPKDLPKTRSIPPVQLEINGRKIFAKGSNWVNPEIFPGIITRERYNELLDRAKEANFNILRVWGGGIINKDSFYELCDEKGILVWQEFPLACNNYEGTPHYLKILEQESESIIKRLKVHPSLALWCGGNELFNSWSKMTDQSLALRLLNSQCYRLDPNTPFLPTSPVMGMAHGNYVFRFWETNEEVFQWMPKSHNSAYTEFGVPALSSAEVLKTIIPESELWPPKPGTSWESHHAFNAWVGDTWLMPDVLKFYFGEAKNIEELVANSQLLQCEGYKCIYEEARRQKPYCSMALNWCFNEPWPTAANNSIVNWPNIPKPGFYAVKSACRPFLASASIKKFKYTEGEEFSADIGVLNDLPIQTDGGKISVKLVTATTELKLLEWKFGSANANTNLSGPTVRCKLPAWQADRFKLVLEVEGHPEYNSEYTLAYQAAAIVHKSTKIQLNQ